MSRSFYGFFEEILRSHITPEIPRLELAEILWTSPVVNANKKDKNLLRKSYTVIDDSLVSKVCSGKRPIPPQLRNKHNAESDALEYVKLCFFEDIVPRIPESEKAALLQEVLDLVNQGDTIPDKTKSYFVQCADNEILGDFLAEVYMYAANQKALKAKPKKKSTSPPVSVSTEVYQTTAETSPLLSSWNNGNLSYTLAQVNGGILGDTIVFNSLSDGVIGDEKKFVGIRKDTGLHQGKDNVWHPDYIDVVPNYVYIIRLYVHNNNPNGLQAVAKDVKAAFQIPTESGSQIRVTGLLESSNATPNKYIAKVVFRSDRIKFHLEYIPGSAKLENRGIGRHPGLKISDDIIAGGVLVSYDSLNGDIPGGFSYASYITIRVKAVADSGFRVEHRVRLAGTTEWKTNIDDVKIGDKLEYRIRYTNTSSKVQENVMIKDILPKSIRYIPGSTVFINASNTLRNFGQDSLFTTGVNVGHYESGANALVDFSAEIIDNDLPNGSCTLVNWSQCCVDGITLQDYSAVTLYKVE